LLIVFQSLTQALLLGSPEPELDQLCTVQSQALDVKPTAFRQTNQPATGKWPDMCK